jgi:hypothetical protein
MPKGDDVSLKSRVCKAGYVRARVILRKPHGILLSMKVLSPASSLVAVKLLHTGVWAVIAACIVALPVTALISRLDWAAILSVVVLAECGVIAFNRGRCPLTNVAAQYTENRADNFDIYLPEWLARHNKAIFGTLFVAGELVVLWRWMS